MSRAKGRSVHYRSGDPVLCPVRALGEMERHYPERFRGAEAEEPLFRFEDGVPITRDDIHGLVQLAAVADGQEGARFGSHSLRIGGATALYQGTKDLEQVKRFGRWTSDAFHGYLWENHERQRGLSARMARADGQLLAPRKDELGVKVGHLGGWHEEDPCEGKAHTQHPTNPETTPEVLQTQERSASRDVGRQKIQGNRLSHRSGSTRWHFQDSVASSSSSHKQEPRRANWSGWRFGEKVVPQTSPICHQSKRLLIDTFGIGCETDALL